MDHNVPTDASNAALLRRARTAYGNSRFTVVRLPGTGHSFTQTSTGNSMSYVQDTHMVACYWNAIEGWLQREVR